MKAGNKIYQDLTDIPSVVPIFPLSGALLLPGSQMPLNLFEPRYLAMLDAALRTDRLVGMIQPNFKDSDDNSSNIDDLVFGDNDFEDIDEDEISAFDVDDWMYVKLRYKLPDEDESTMFDEMAGKEDFTTRHDRDFVFAAAVAEYALLLKDSEYASDASYDSLIKRARDSKGRDEHGYRAQFIQLAELASTLDD